LCETGTHNNSIPEMWRLSSDARNATGFAISSGVPSLPDGFRVPRHPPGTPLPRRRLVGKLADLSVLICSWPGRLLQDRGQTIGLDQVPTTPFLASVRVADIPGWPHIPLNRANRNLSHLASRLSHQPAVSFARSHAECYFGSCLWPNQVSIPGKRLVYPRLERHRPKGMRRSSQERSYMARVMPGQN
jgi:hypothetical protein